MTPRPDSRCTAGGSCSVCAGGIAAYKAVEVCRRLVDAGAHVMPVLTEDALRFVGALTFSALASEPARTSLFDAPEPIPHTRLGQTADLIVVAPATAKLLGKYAAGISDDLAHRDAARDPRAGARRARDAHRDVGAPRGAGEPRHAAPPRRARRRTPKSGGSPAATRAPVASPTRRDRGGGGERARPSRAISRACGCSSPQAAPASRSTRCGSSATGRRGRRATRSPRSRRGAVPRSRSSPPSAGPAPPSVEIVHVQTAAEMQEAVLRARGRDGRHREAAAVADFRPKEPPEHKLKKDEGIPEIVLEPTPDFSLELGARKRRARCWSASRPRPSDLVAQRGAEARREAPRPHRRQRRRGARCRLRGRHEPGRPARRRRRCRGAPAAQRRSRSPGSSSIGCAPCSPSNEKSNDDLSATRSRRSRSPRATPTRCATRSATRCSTRSSSRTRRAASRARRCAPPGLVVVAGEITTQAYVDIQRVVRDTVRSIGYTDASYGFDGQHLRGDHVDRRAVARHRAGRRQGAARCAPASATASTRWAPATRG